MAIKFTSKDLPLDDKPGKAVKAPVPAAAAPPAALIGGAAGNIVDRLRHRAVTDFLDVYIGAAHWPAFNLADVAITLGVVLLLARTLFIRDKNGDESGPENGPAPGKDRTAQVSAHSATE